MFTTEQMAASIVRDVLGDVRITPQQVAEAAYKLGRSKYDHRAMALFCDYFLKACRNFNSEFDTNGERMVLRRLAVLGPQTIFDVGANEGEWALMARAEIPDAHIHAFEIIAETFRALARRLPAGDRIFLNDCGLFSHTGEIEMHTFAESNTLASHMAYPHGSARRDMTCRVRAGDDYMREQGIERLDFLKIDAEGAESEILKGFSAALGQGRIDVVQFEYGKVNILTHFLLYDFYQLFESKGYAVGKIYPDFVDFRPYALDDEDFLGPNYLACRRARADILELLGKQK